MSLSRHEQRLFDYVKANPEEFRHWQGKVESRTRQAADLGWVTRNLERDLREYLAERAENVAALRDLRGDAARLRLLNLAEYLVRVWGPPPRPRKKLPGPAV